MNLIMWVAAQSCQGLSFKVETPEGPKQKSVIWSGFCSLADLRNLDCAGQASENVARLPRERLEPLVPASYDY